MKKKFKKQLAGIIASMLALVLAILLDKLNIINIEDYLKLDEGAAQYEVKGQDTADIDNKKTYEVVRVVDGDTFVINYDGKDEKVRLIGIDTPESVHPDERKNTEFGKQISKYSKDMLSGKQVVLEFDVEKRDKYGRLLAYIYLDGQMYNKLLLQKDMQNLQHIHQM